jgi:hypothetical protein
VGRDVATPLIVVCLRVIVIQPVFVHGHQSQQEINLIVPNEKKIPNVLQTTGTDDVFVSGISEPNSRRVSHAQIFMNDGPNPLT